MMHDIIINHSTTYVIVKLCVMFLVLLLWFVVSAKPAF
jgi:hypothetical protein